MKTLILFLSVYNGQPESDYETDCGFSVTGAQTNEAPVKYAINRLAIEGEKLDRIIALVTPKAKETAFEHFSNALKAVSSETEILPVDIPNNVTTTELLHKTLDALLPLRPSDSVIIETTGGYRNSVSSLTLLSHFLHLNGTDIVFSTYSDYEKKYITDTSETDSLFDMLEAVNIFATSGNPLDLIRSLKSLKAIPNKTEFIIAIRKFYDMVLCCKISQLDTVIVEMRDAILGIINADYDADNPELLIFRDIVSEVIRTKMDFIFEDNYLELFVKW